MPAYLAARVPIALFLGAASKPNAGAALRACPRSYPQIGPQCLGTNGRWWWAMPIRRGAEGLWPAWCGRAVGGPGGWSQFLVKTGSKPYAVGASSYQNSRCKSRVVRGSGRVVARCLFFGRCWQTQYWRGFGALVRVVVHSLAHSCGGQAGALACAPAGIADNAHPGAAPWRCGHLGLGRRWRVLSPSLTSSF